MGVLPQFAISGLLHDVGKVKEFTFNPGIEYTDEGKLLGHIVLGLQMADELMARRVVFHQSRAAAFAYDYQSPWGI